jgi:hypothetical protein
MTQPSSITPASVRGRWLALPLAFALGLAGTVNAETVVLPARKPLHPIDAPASGIHVRSVELPDEMSSVTGTPFTSSAVLDRSFGILIGGSFSVAGAQNIMRVAPQGDFDPNFARLTLNDRVFAIANHVNGSGYYISGAFDEVRLDGTVVDDHRHAMSIHYGGGAPTIEGGLLPRLDGFARLMLESSFHSQGNTRQLLIGGDFHAANGSTVHLLGRFNTTGGLLAAYDIDDGNQVRTLASYPDGRVLVGGMFPAPGSPGHYSIVRLNPDGSRDPSFLASATEGTGRVNVIAIQPDGRIVIGGNFQYVNNVARNNLARLHPDGTLDPTFQANTDGDVYSILLLGGGEMFVGGHFTSIQGSTASGPLALLQADGTPWVVTPADGAVYGLTGTSRTDMIVTGGFTQLGGGPTPHRFGIASVIHPSNSEQFVVQPDGSSLVFRLKRNGLLSLPARTFILLSTDQPGIFQRIGEAAMLADGTIELANAPRPQGAGPYTYRAELRFTGGHGNNSLSFDVSDSQIQLVQHRITVNVSGTGSYAMGPPWVITGEQRQIEVQPAAGEYFEGISGCGTSGQFPVFTTAPANGDCTIEIRYADRIVSAVADGLGQVMPASQPVNLGGSVQFQVTPAAGHGLRDLDVRDLVAGTCPDAVVQGNTVIAGPVNAGRCGYLVHMRRIDFTVTPSVNGSGSLSPSKPVQVEAGGSTQFTLTPASGWRIDGVDGTCGGQLNGNVFTTAAIHASCTVVARFAQDTVKLGVQVLPLLPWALYGQDFGYHVVVTNPGKAAVAGISVNSPVPDGADMASVHWACLGPAATGCTPIGSGALAQSGVNVPAGGSVTWLVQGLVDTASTLPWMQPSASVAASQMPAPASAAAHIVLALFLDGLETGSTGDEEDAIPH